MKIQLYNRIWGMFQKTDPANCAEVYIDDGGEDVLIVLLKGSKLPVPVSHITLNRGELLATLNFSNHVQSYREPAPESGNINHSTLTQRVDTEGRVDVEDGVG